MNVFTFDDIVKKGCGMTIEECQLLEKTANIIKPKVVVEIGSKKGTSSMVLGFVVKKTNGHLYCIESTPINEWRQNIKDLELTEYVTLIEEPSPWVDLGKIEQPIDYLFIDANHKTRWVIVDYHFWERFLRIGGRIAFHDWRSGRKESSIEGQKEDMTVQRAVNIILEDDNEKLIEIAKLESHNGMIVFEKIK